LCWVATAAASACKQVAAASSLVRRYISGCASRVGHVLGLLHLFIMPWQRALSHVVHIFGLLHLLIVPFQYLYITRWLQLQVASELVPVVRPFLACAVGALQLLLLPGTRVVLRHLIGLPGRMRTWLFQVRARCVRPQYEPGIRVGPRTLKSLSRPAVRAPHSVDPLVQERVWQGGLARCWLLLAANHTLWIASTYRFESCTAYPCVHTLPDDYYGLMVIFHWVFACLWLGMSVGPSEAVGSLVLLKYPQRLVTILFWGHWGAPCSVPPTGTVAGAVFSTLSHLLFGLGPANVAFALWQQAEFPVAAAAVRGVFLYVSRALSGSSWVVADCIAALMVVVVCSVLTGWRFWGQLLEIGSGAAIAVAFMPLQVTRGIKASVTRSGVQLQLLLGWLKSAVASVRRFTTPHASRPVPCSTPAGAQPRSRTARLNASCALVMQKLFRTPTWWPVQGGSSGMYAGLRLWLPPAQLRSWFVSIKLQLVKPRTWWRSFRSSKSSTSNCAGSSTAAGSSPAGDSSSSVAAHPTEPVTARAEALTAAAQEAMRECVICQDETRSVALKPCGHLACCEACFARLQRDASRCSPSRRSGPGRLKCPVCRADVQGHVAGIIL
jgi:hypothetical protein